MRWFDPVCWTLAGLLLFVSLVGFLGKLFWAFDLLSHFRVQYLQLGLLVAGFCLWVRRNKCAVVLLLIAAFNYIFIYPFYLGKPAAPAPGAPKSTRIMHLNLNAANGNAEAVKQTVEQVNADLLVFAEVTPGWAFELSGLSERYPHHIVKPRENAFGIAILSRLPLSREREEILGSAEVPSLLATVHLPEGDLALIGTHPPPPFNAVFSAHRNNQFQALAAAVREQKDPVLLIGDLNCSPWSPHFRQLLSDAGLRNSMKGFGFQSTWPASNPFVRIPIDHALHDSRVLIRNRIVGSDVGSDHLPLILEIALR